MSVSRDNVFDEDLFLNYKDLQSFFIQNNCGKLDKDQEKYLSEFDSIRKLIVENNNIVDNFFISNIRKNFNYKSIESFFFHIGKPNYFYSIQNSGEPSHENIVKNTFEYRHKIVNQIVDKIRILSIEENKKEIEKKKKKTKKVFNHTTLLWDENGNGVEHIMSYFYNILRIYEYKIEELRTDNHIRGSYYLDGDTENVDTLISSMIKLDGLLLEMFRIWILEDEYKNLKTDQNIIDFFQSKNVF